jgi:hypothetical protein
MEAVGAEEVWGRVELYCGALSNYHAAAGCGHPRRSQQEKRAVEAARKIAETDYDWR